MQRFVKAVRKSVADANWYSALSCPALSLALLLPDICGYLETPEEKSGARYARWFQQWLEPKYSGFVPDANSSEPRAGTVRVFLSGADCYAVEAWDQQLTLLWQITHAVACCKSIFGNADIAAAVVE